MAGQIGRRGASALAWVALAGSLVAQTPAPTPLPLQLPRKEGKNWGPGRPEEGGPNAPAYENVRKALEALTPEQRKRFQENFLRWSNLPPEEKKALRDREEVRKRFIEQETSAAIQESGLELEGDRREQFIKRYAEGRRLIEDQVRKEMMERRKPLVHELISRLRTEFASEASASAASQEIQTAPTSKP